MLKFIVLYQLNVSMITTPKLLVEIMIQLKVHTQLLFYFGGQNYILALLCIILHNIISKTINIIVYYIDNEFKT